MNMKEHPDMMLSDIELRWCRDCQQYWSIKNFYLDRDGKDYGYCKEHHLQRVKAAKERLRERQRMQQPKREYHRRTDTQHEEPQTIDSCNTCKSFSKHNGGKSGWCMRRRKTVKLRECCGNYRPDIKARYELTATQVTLVNSTPYS